MATASVVLGVLSFLPVLGWLSVLGLVLALVGRGRGEQPTTRSRAKVGLWINAVSLAWLPILVTLVVSGAGAALLGVNAAPTGLAAASSTAAPSSVSAAPWSPPAAASADPQEVARDQRLAAGDLTRTEQQFINDVDPDRASLAAASLISEKDVIGAGYGVCSYVAAGVSEGDAATELAGQNYLDPGVAAGLAHAAVTRLC